MLPSTRPAAEFTEQQLKQLRAQFLVFLSLRNNTEPRKIHLQIALGECPSEGSSGGGGDRRGDDDGDDHSQQRGIFRHHVSSSSSELPPPDLQALSSLRLSSPEVRARMIRRGGPRKITK